MVVESVGEHTMKFDDKALMDGIVQMLKGNHSKSVWVVWNAQQTDFLFIFVCYG